MDRRILLTLSGVLLGAAFVIIIFYGFPGGETPNPARSIEEGEPVEVEEQSGNFSASSRAPESGQPAEGFSLQDLDGESVSLDDYRGQVVLLNFWATWCGPCRIEMPYFQSRFELLREEGFTVLAVNFDETAEQVKGFRDELGLTFPLVLDPGGQVQRQYRIRGYPTSVIIDRSGEIHEIHVGIMSESQLDAYLEELGFGL